MKNVATALILCVVSFGSVAGGTYGGNIQPTAADYAQSWNGKAGKQVLNRGVRIEWFADACGTKDGHQFDASKCSK
ncbi:MULTISPECIES: hypothetical protein [unclassified Vibrio]|uniref:hypothetical protein n=1 Tax=Vibrio TaxID=662 RepID=UPI001267DEED|nr:MULTISPECIES: hypothetical protein [unclassified Vibrio]QFT40025.1 hypothetical protein FIU99_26915 [Vibrio sp. THAF64]QGM37970.1 hypothetical protein GGC04_27120 [Vibrio sp. THAF191d]QGN73450.1 hypothetical protein GGC03_27055 [Vibrio sp. THAF191c]